MQARPLPSRDTITVPTVLTIPIIITAKPKLDPVFHPGDEDLSLGTPAFREPDRWGRIPQPGFIRYEYMGGFEP